MAEVNWSTGEGITLQYLLEGGSFTNYRTLRNLCAAYWGPSLAPDGFYIAVERLVDPAYLAAAGQWMAARTYAQAVRTQQAREEGERG